MLLSIHVSLILLQYLNITTSTHQELAGSLPEQTFRTGVRKEHYLKPSSEASHVYYRGGGGESEVS